MKNFLCALIVLGGLTLIGFAAFVAWSALNTSGLTEDQGLGVVFAIAGSVVTGGMMIGIAMDELPSGSARASEECDEEDADE